MKAILAVYPEWYVSCDQVARAKSNNGNEEFRDLPICKFTSGEGGGRGERGRPGEGDVRSERAQETHMVLLGNKRKGVNRANAGKWERGGIYGVGEEGPGGQQNHKFKTKEEYENERTKQELQQHH